MKNLARKPKSLFVGREKRRKTSVRPPPELNVGIGPRFEHTVRQAFEFGRTIGGNIADLRRVGKGGSGLPLPNFYDFGRLPSIVCDPFRSMVALRQRARIRP
ncbi:hypothetical protein [Bradyrhizobium rifense]|uniref:hypothetical protein n=1 Tax=Bradyrhizobium rifense TaxID=515499 RepID=UPI0011E7E1A1|nr:hypothetical protein [Bradyrhizobium rifense]